MEDTADQWVPPGSDSGARDPLGSGRREGEGCWARGGGANWAAAFHACWAEKKKEGGEALGLRADFHGERGEKNKYFSNFIFNPLLN